MKVWIDQDLCTGDGLCEEIAPDVFIGLDDGLYYVKEGENLIFIESMKMEIPVIAPFDSEIEEIFVKKDEVISQNQPLLTLKS